MVPLLSSKIKCRPHTRNIYFVLWTCQLTQLCFEVSNIVMFSLKRCKRSRGVLRHAGLVETHFGSVHNQNVIKKNVIFALVEKTTMFFIRLSIILLFLCWKQVSHKTSSSQHDLLVVDFRNNQVFGSYESKLQFLIRSDFIYIKTENGNRTLVTFYKYDVDVHYLHVLDYSILRYVRICGNADSRHQYSVSTN